MRYLILFLLLLSSCAPSMDVTKNGTFNSDASITIIPRGNDWLGVQPRLEHTFLSNGFDVVSEETVKNKITYNSQQNSDSYNSEMTGVKDIESVYALSFSYKTRVDIPNGRVFSNFNATVVDMRDNRVVASTSFSQGDMSGQSIEKTLNNFVNKLIE